MRSLTVSVLNFFHGITFSEKHLFLTPFSEKRSNTLKNTKTGIKNLAFLPSCFDPVARNENRENTYAMEMRNFRGKSKTPEKEKIRRKRIFLAFSGLFKAEPPGLAAAD